MMILVRKFCAVFFVSISVVSGAVSMEAFVTILNGRVEEDKKYERKNISTYSEQRDQAKNKQNQPREIQGEYGRTVKLNQSAKL
jgi:hypothetical protein